MKSIARAIVNNRKIILIATVLLLIVAIGLLVGVVVDDKINGDLMGYINEDSNTSQGISFLFETFNIKGDALMVVTGEKDDPGLRETITKLKGMEGVSQMIWVGDMEMGENMLKLLDGDVGDMLEDILGEDFRIEYNFRDVINYLKQPADPSNPDGLYNYVLLGMIDYPPSTNDALALITDIREMFEEQGRTVEMTGMTALSDSVLNGIMGELPYYILFALLAVIFILIITSDSFIDPIVLLTTLGVSILVALGTNYIFEDVSIITFALSSILQLAVTMDYAIFFLHVYKEKRRKGLSANDAIVESAPSVWSSIIASCMTTIGGFAALYCMQFTLGADLAKVLIKAVVLSLLSVMILQPVLMIVLDKATQKTSHRALYLPFKLTSNIAVKARTVLLTIAAILIIPAFLLQGTTSYSYFKIFKDPETPTTQQVLSSELYNQLMCAVPVKPKDGQDPQEFLAEIAKIEQVKQTISIYSILDVDPDLVETLVRTLNGEDTDITIPDSMISMMELVNLDDMMGNFFGRVELEDGSTQYYTMYTFVIAGADESDASMAVYHEISDKVAEYYDDYYTMGILTGVDDMKTITPTDFRDVTIVSIAIIFIVLLVLLLNLRESILVVLLIELGIWINMALNVVLGADTNFMVYIILSSVQLGCTVDYAILMCTRYKTEYIKALGDKKLAAKNAASATLFSITTSASIIASVCLVCMVVSKNTIVKEMTGLLARGAIISYVLVMLVLPGILSFVKPTLLPKERKVYGAAIAEKKAKIAKEKRLEEERQNPYPREGEVPVIVYLEDK